ncbi:hypothetical protein Tco_0511625 [Tanacetum coccineum]
MKILRRQNISSDPVTQEEFIGTFADNDGDERRQSALLRLALDDVLDSLKPKETLVIRQRYGFPRRGAHKPKSREFKGYSPKDPTFGALGAVTLSPTSGALGALTQRMQLFNLTSLLIRFLTTCSTSAYGSLRKSTHPVMAIFLYLMVVDGFEVEGFEIGGFKVEGFVVEAFEVYATFEV